MLSLILNYPEDLNENKRMKHLRIFQQKVTSQKALSYANLKYQAIILLMSNSGMRASDVRCLKYSDLLSSLNDYLKTPITDMVNVERNLSIYSIKMKMN